MAEQTSVQYVGKYTHAHLWEIAHGQETLATLKRRRKGYDLMQVIGDPLLSVEEAIVIVEQQQAVEKTPKERVTEMQVYQQDLSSLARDPGLYYAPEQARAWYEQQIQRIRQHLQHHR